jgi:putative oxidoreductase
MPATNDRSCCCPICEKFSFVRHFIYCDTTGWLGSIGLLALRLVMGAAFILHGWPKIQNPTGWMGQEATVPAILQTLAAVAEFGGGMALIVGLLTRLASLGIMTNMIVAIGMVHLPHGDPFVGKPGGPSFELAAIYLACAIVFLILGSGRCSLDAFLFGSLFKGKQSEAGQRPMAKS